MGYIHVSWFLDIWVIIPYIVRKIRFNQPVDFLDNPKAEHRWGYYEEIFTDCTYVEYGADGLSAHHEPRECSFRCQPDFPYL